MLEFLPLVALLAPWITFAILRSISKRHLATVIGFSLSVFIVYAAMVSYAHQLDVKFEHELAAYDLNKDGSFDESEMTPLQIQAMDNWANDTGRALAPYTSILVSLSYTAFALISWFAASWAISKFNPNRI